MRVIIKDQFYEFQNSDTEKIFSQQKEYLATLVERHDASQDVGALLTHLLSLYNLTEALIDGIVTSQGLEQTIVALNAKSID